MHIAWNVHFEAVSLRVEEEGREGSDIRQTVKGVRRAKGLKTAALGN